MTHTSRARSEPFARGRKAFARVARVTRVARAAWAPLALGVTALASLASSSCSEDRASEPVTHLAVHPTGIAVVGSPDFHGKVLRARRWSQMLDKNDPEACGRCHDGTSSRPDGVTFAAPGATPCTTCHAEPKGILACSTCHTETLREGAHAAHVNPSASHATGIACSTCHPTVGADDPNVIGGLHGNGAVEIAFDPAVVPNEASFDPRTGACAVACHDRKGKRPLLAWTDKGPLGCNDCHSSPPPAHFAGACTSCHRDVNADGTVLSKPTLHMNGRVDLGDGSGKCGACHGEGDSPWPTTGAHAAHATQKLGADVACASCHVVPASVSAPGHLDGQVTIAFSGAARARGSRPVWNGVGCSDTACHGGKLDVAAMPVWSDTSGSASKCGACHGIPPTEQHTSSTSCDRSTCHGAVVTRGSTGVPMIDPTRRALHINGVIDLAVP
ncbi:MAG: hypothetical protein JWM74_6299 [Myxococcaceae bacterium]|nr:hypothetical protein [Myxococcaceae bacterium]